MTNRKLPFDCAVGTVAVYDVIIGSSMMAEKATSSKAQAKLYKEVRKGLDWFMKHEPRAYMVLLD